MPSNDYDSLDFDEDEASNLEPSAETANEDDDDRDDQRNDREAEDDSSSEADAQKTASVIVHPSAFVKPFTDDVDKAATDAREATAIHENCRISLGRVGHLLTKSLSESVWFSSSYRQQMVDELRKFSREERLSNETRVAVKSALECLKERQEQILLISSTALPADVVSDKPDRVLKTVHNTEALRSAIRTIETQLPLGLYPIIQGMVEKLREDVLLEVREREAPVQTSPQADAPSRKQTLHANPPPPPTVVLSATNEDPSTASMGSNATKTKRLLNREWWWRVWEEYPMLAVGAMISLVLCLCWVTIKLLDNPTNETTTRATPSQPTSPPAPPTPAPAPPAVITPSTWHCVRSPETCARYTPPTLAPEQNAPQWDCNDPNGGVGRTIVNNGDGTYNLCACMWCGP